MEIQLEQHKRNNTADTRHIFLTMRDLLQLRAKLTPGNIAKISARLAACYGHSHRNMLMRQMTQKNAPEFRYSLLWLILS